jgi:hypothetical protein
MNAKEAQNFSVDILKELDDTSFSDSLYFSIRNVGTKVFRQCKYDQIEGWLFIWTKQEVFFMKESDLGDFVVIDANQTVSSLI